MDDGAGMAPRRRQRIHPQIHASEEGAGVTPRRSPRLHPKIHTSGPRPRMTRHRIRRRRGTSPAVAASLPEDNNMLREILTSLLPQPSSLPRASAVCKRWRGLVTDAKFQRQFRAHHRQPPLLGAFVCRFGGEEIAFTSVLDPPDRMHPQRFSLGRGSHALLDCRHCRVLIHNSVRKGVVVCDPIMAVPPDFNFACLDGAVLCAASDLGHVHGGCHSSPFKVVLISICRKDKRQIACVYSSETSIWGNLIPAEAPAVYPRG